jgi:uncharacterized protein involved in cysteine biosynthesis
VRSATQPAPVHLPGFFAGVRAFTEGVGFILRTPAVWGYSLVPAAIAFALFLVFGTTGAILIAGTVQEATVTSSTLLVFGAWLLGGIVGLVTLIAAALVASSLAQPLSGFALEAIARNQALLMGKKLWVSPRGLAPFFRALGVTLTALAFAGPALALLTVMTLLFPPWAVVTIPLKFAVTGLALSWDFLDYPFSLRHAGVGERLRWVGRHFFAVLGFGLAASFVMLIPGVGLFVLPMGVAGATRLLAESDRARRYARAGG